ncbi:hypothetical protein ACWENQ_45575 [Nonomuraea sp. NPDC004354]
MMARRDRQPSVGAAVAQSAARTVVRCTVLTTLMASAAQAEVAIHLDVCTSCATTTRGSS